MNRIRRRTLWWALLCWGLLLLVFAFGPRAELALPGPLSEAHAVLVGDCGACHGSEWDDIKGLEHGIAVSAAAIGESRRCLRCHDLGEYALLAHTQPAEALAREGEPPGASARWPAPPRTPAGELPCADCHREHGGRDARLTRVPDRACEVCHRDDDDAFPQRHPEFSSWPFADPGRIAFTHDRHRVEHFADAGLAFDCADCHSVGAGGFMVTASYEAGCTGCHHHDERIRGAGRMQRGLPVLRLPGLDLESLTAGGVDVGQWPADAADGCEEPTSVVADFLLARDRRYRERRQDLARIRDLDLADLSAATAEELAAVGRYVRALKRLLGELARSPAPALRALLADLAPATAGPLAEGVSAAAIRAALVRWLPELPAELEALGIAGEAGLPAAEEWTGSGTWYLGDGDFTVYCVPSRHDDPFLKALHDLAAAESAAGHLQADALRRMLAGDGRCTDCHRIDAGLGGVHWHAARPPLVMGFTRFDHRPHLLEPPPLGERSCDRCHQTVSQESAGSEFASLHRADCAECHRNSLASHRCTTCHRYHIGRRPELVRSR